MPVKNTKKADVAPASMLENPDFTHALTYVPYFIGAVSMYFLAKTDKKALMHHVKYSAMLAVAAVLLVLILNGLFGSIVSLGYLVLSGILAYRAYKGEVIKIDILDTVEKKISEIFSK